VKSHSEKERRKANQAKPDQTGPTYLQKKGSAPSSSWPQLAALTGLLLARKMHQCMQQRAKTDEKQKEAKAT